MGFLPHRIKLLGSLLFDLPRLRAIDRRTHRWDQILDEAQAFAGRFLNPLQVRSEVVPFLEELERLQPRRILEIGTATGGMFYLLARAAAPDAHLISLDLPGGKGGGGYANWKVPVYRRLARRGQTATFVRASSHDPSSLAAVQATLQGEPLDLLFIDGDHTYEGVKQDFEMYSPLVRPDGVIALHDIVPNPSADCVVHPFWEQIKVRYPNHEYVEDWQQGTMGIGLLRNTAHTASARAAGEQTR